MNKRIYILMVVLGIISGLIAGPKALYATSIIIPGESDYEREACARIMEMDNADDIAYEYLGDQSVAVRAFACKRIGDISSDTTPLWYRVNDESEDYTVKNEASFAIWKILYRQDKQSGGDGLSVLRCIFVEPDDITKIETVKLWALNLLGDNGDAEDLDIFDTILEDPDQTKYSKEIKEAVAQNKDKVLFISSLTPEEAITQGLQDPRLYIKLWALEKLVKNNPPDLKTQLENLLSQARASYDTTFASYIEMELERIKYQELNPPISFEYPQDGDTLKESEIDLIWYEYGNRHSEKRTLTPSQNILTVTSADGTVGSITVYLQNEGPTLGNIEDRTIEAGQTLNIPLADYTYDPDDTNLLYFAFAREEDEPGIDYGINYDTKTFYFTSSQVGTYPIRIKVDDGWGLTTEETINVITVESRITLNPIGDRQGSEAQTFVIRKITATDPDGDPITISSPNLPNGARLFQVSSSNIGRVEYKLSWPAKFVRQGFYNVIFVASDPTGATDPETITITINDTQNFAPVLAPIRNRTGIVGRDFILKGIVATDFDNNPITIEVQNAPPGSWVTQTSASNIGKVEYKFVWRARGIRTGTYNVTFIARDPAGGIDSETITITINGAQ